MAETSTTFCKAGLELELRHLAEEDAEQLYEMCQSVGWTFITRENLSENLHNFPGAMWGAFDKDNTLISTCSFYPVTEGTVYFTFYITRPENQRKGIGKHIYQEIVKRLGSPNILLTAAPEAEPIYKAWGYSKSVHRLCSFQGKLKYPASLKDAPYSFEPMEQHFDRVVAFERESVSGYDRAKNLRMILKSPQLVCAKCAILDGEIYGFIVVHYCSSNNGMSTSAFQARDYDTATALFNHVAREYVGTETELTARCSGANYEACEKLYTSFGLEPVGREFQGMYRIKDLDVAWDKVYSLLNFAISFQ